MLDQVTGDLGVVVGKNTEYNRETCGEGFVSRIEVDVE
jgi:hypothetical protein